MSIEVRCTEGHKLSVPDHLAGKIVRCPKCSAATRVPNAKSVADTIVDDDFDIPDPEELEFADEDYSMGGSSFDEDSLEQLPQRKKKQKPKPTPVPKPKQSESRAPATAKMGIIASGAMLATAVLGVCLGALIAPKGTAPKGTPSSGAKSAESKSVAGKNDATETQPNPVAKASPEPTEKVTQDSSTDSAAAEWKTALNLPMRSAMRAKELAAAPPLQPQPQPQPAGTARVVVVPQKGQNPPNRTNRPPIVRPQPAQTVPERKLRASEIVQLPGAIQEIVTGGSGRFLVATIPSAKVVAVVDVAAKQILKEIAVDDRDVLVAAGESKFVILQRSTGVISRYDLDTAERELTISSEPCNYLAMGSSSEGPLLAVGSKYNVLDLKSLKPLDVRVEHTPFGDLSNLVASANGRVFGSWRNNSSPTGITIFELLGKTLKSTYEHDSVGSVIPSPDGRMIYTNAGRFWPTAKRLDNMGMHNGNEMTLAVLPAATGPFYLKLVGSDFPPTANGSHKLTIHSQNDAAPLFPVNDVALPDLTQQQRLRQAPSLPYHRRLFLLPAIDALVTVPGDHDKLVIQPFDIEEELNKAVTDYLLVTSSPPSRVVRGGKLSYPIEVLSKGGNVQFALETGPKGMAISPKGVVTWAVPADYNGGDIVAVVSIRNDAKKEISHTIKIGTAATADEINDSSVPTVRKSMAKKNNPPKPKVPVPDPNASKAKTAKTNVPARTREIVPLPAPAQQTVIGGSGKFLISFLPESKQVAILNVAAKKITKLLPVDDRDSLIAAGETKLVVAQRGTGVISRYNLSTFERELTVAFEPCASIAMGASSEGPLLVLSNEAKLFDLETLTPTDIKTMVSHGAHNAMVGFAAANGKAFGTAGGVPPGLHTLVVTGDTIQHQFVVNGTTTAQPSPDGRVFYTGLGRFAADGKSLAGQQSNYATQVLTPAPTGTFYLSLALAGVAGSPNRGPTRLTVNCQNDDSPLFTAVDITLPEVENNIHPAHVAQLHHEQRLFLLPIVNALVTLPAKSDQYQIHNFNLKQELDRSETDYFFVASVPPAHYVPGKDFSYPIEVMSKKGNVRFTLDNSPKGMSISSTGVLNWKVPADAATGEVVAIVNIRDNSSRELSHVVKLTAKELPKAAGGAKPAETDPNQPAAATPDKPAETEPK